MEAQQPEQTLQSEVEAAIRRCLRQRHQIDRPTAECLCRLAPELLQTLSGFETLDRDVCEQRIKNLMTCRCQAVTEGELTTFDDRTLDEIAHAIRIELDRTLSTATVTVSGEPAHWFG